MVTIIGVDHLLVGVPESIHKSIDALVELVKVHLHVLLLRFKVLSLLIRMEVFKMLLLVIILLLVLLLLVLLFLFLSITLGGVILLDHESVPPLQRPSPNVLRRLRKKIAQLKQLALRNAHEVNVLIWLDPHQLLLVIRQGFENDVGLQIVQDLVVTKVGEFGQI